MLIALLTDVAVLTQTAAADPYEQMGEGLGYLLIFGGAGYLLFRSTQRNSNEKKK